MNDVLFSNIKDHQVFHSSFMYELDLYNIGYISGAYINPEKITSFIKEWWMNHIRNEDNYFIKQQSLSEEQLIYEQEIA